LSVLLVDPSDGHGLADSLERCGFTVTASETPEAALFELSQHAVDAVVASLPLAGMGASDFCRQLDERGRTPVLVVTPGRGSEWLAALRVGADDHVAAPCDERELRARVRALVRRYRGRLSPESAITVGELTVRFGFGTVSLEPPLALTPVQSTLLEHLAAHPGVVLSEHALRERVDVVHGRVSDQQFHAEIQGLRDAIGVTSRVPDALDHIEGGGWCLAKSDR
jgi:DNA-binding response OmpR family regulator